MPIITLYLLFAMIMVIASDVSRYTIPNWLVGSLLVLYPIAVYVSPVPIDWIGGLYALVICFAVGYIIFTMRWMGGGDIKLIIACSLWVGLNSLLDFIFLMTLVGGIFALSLLFGRKALSFIPLKGDKELPRILTVGAPVPYGVAIAFSFLYLLWAGQLAAASLKGISL